MRAWTPTWPRRCWAFTPPARLRHAAQQMGAGAAEPEPGWLEVVLSWPDRIARPAWDMNLPAAATG